MFNKLEAGVLSEYKRSRAAPSTFCTLIKHYFSFIKHYVKQHCPYNKVKYWCLMFICIVRRDLFINIQVVPHARRSLANRVHRFMYCDKAIFKTGNGESGKPGIGETGNRDTGIVLIYNTNYFIFKRIRRGY